MDVFLGNNALDSQVFCEDQLIVRTFSDNKNIWSSQRAKQDWIFELPEFHFFFIILWAVSCSVLRFKKKYFRLCSSCERTSMQQSSRQPDASCASDLLSNASASPNPRPASKQAVRSGGLQIGAQDVINNHSVYWVLWFSLALIRLFKKSAVFWPNVRKSFTQNRRLLFNMYGRSLQWQKGKLWASFVRSLGELLCNVTFTFLPYKL